MINEKYTTFELLSSLMKSCESMKALKSMKNKICTGWCNKGCYCNEDRCIIAKTFEELRPIMLALDVANSDLMKSASTSKKDRWQQTKHREGSKVMMGSIMRSITCTRKRESDPVKIAALDKAMEYAKKYNKQQVKMIAEKYGFDKLLIVINNNTNVYKKRNI